MGYTNGKEKNEMREFIGREYDPLYNLDDILMICACGKMAQNSTSEGAQLTLFCNACNPINRNKHIIAYDNLEQQYKDLVDFWIDERMVSEIDPVTKSVRIGRKIVEDFDNEDLDFE
jgi:hypothetical protein